MIKFFKKYFWTMLIVIAALGLAGSAAYFSISGLSKLFAGSAMQVIIMASFIELSKIITTASLHRYWRSMKSLSMKVLKYMLTLMVVVVMAITSSGIYGFLADSYSKTSIELDKIDGQIELVEKQIVQKKQQIEGVEELKRTKTERINSLIELRGQQETRLDSLYNKGWYNSARRTQNLIEQSSLEIKNLQSELDSLSKKINSINEEVGKMNINILDLKNTDVATEIGPLKYMSTVFNRPMDNIINWFIMMIIFVFDPLAVLLVIFANVVYDNSSKSKDDVEDVSDFEDTPNDSISDEDKDVYDYSHNDEHQRVIDAVNSEEDPENYDYSYEFIPEERNEQVVEYVSNKDGDFEKTDNIESIINSINPNPVYIQLVSVLFEDGKRKVGDVIPPYKSLVRDINTKGIETDEKTLKNFLTICNLLDIVDMSDKDNVHIIKDYSASKQIISLVSK